MAPARLRLAALEILAQRKFQAVFPGRFSGVCRPRLVLVFLHCRLLSRVTALSWPRNMAPGPHAMQSLGIIREPATGTARRRRRKYGISPALQAFPGSR